MVGHVKEKDVIKESGSFTEKSINLTGRTKDILCSWCDAIGLVYRDENRTVINFAPSESLVAGSRQKHLIGQQIEVAVSDENYDITVDWSRIFIEEKTKVIPASKEK